MERLECRIGDELPLQFIPDSRRERSLHRLRHKTPDNGGGTSWVLIGNTTARQAIATSTGAFLSIGGAWTDASDRDRKTAERSIDPHEILQKVSALPITSWQYKDEDAGVRHLGPMAQDFRAAFELGMDDKSIATIDCERGGTRRDPGTERPSPSSARTDCGAAERARRLARDSSRDDGPRWLNYVRILQRLRSQSRSRLRGALAGALLICFGERRMAGTGR